MTAALTAGPRLYDFDILPFVGAWDLIFLAVKASPKRRNLSTSGKIMPLRFTAGAAVLI